MPPSSMNTMPISSTAALSKNAMLASCVENPPVDTVVNAWPTASNGVMPASQ
jgi:hypothetical protein